jgi:hypothetical protein
MSLPEPEEAPPSDPPSKPAAKPLPFAKLPHAICADKRLTHADCRVIWAVMYWAWDKPTCWPSNKQIGQQCHIEPRSVARSLRRLETYGHIRSETNLSKPSKRLITLLWHPEAAPTAGSPPHDLSVGGGMTSGSSPHDPPVILPMTGGSSEQEPQQDRYW